LHNGLCSLRCLCQGWSPECDGMPRECYSGWPWSEGYVRLDSPFCFLPRHFFFYTSLTFFFWPVFWTDHTGCTPLIEAIKNGHVEIVDALLKKGMHTSSFRLPVHFEILMWSSSSLPSFSSLTHVGGYN
jgi:hypothetical protein